MVSDSNKFVLIRSEDRKPILRLAIKIMRLSSKQQVL